MDMIYIAYFQTKKENIFNEELILQSKNRLFEMLPDNASWNEGIKVIDGDSIRKGKKLYLHADSMNQTVYLYLNE
jgi:hypothetical protein